MTRRATIADIAQRAGLSKGAVSYALNGLPGVSESTRQRVLKLAAEMGWRPNSAARALSASRAGALGLVMARGQHPWGRAFLLKLMSSLENQAAAPPPGAPGLPTYAEASTGAGARAAVAASS